jgi:hypothetical protein
MTDFGKLIDYKTGDYIRQATAAEWRKTADALGDSGDGYTGTWLSDDSRPVYVEGGPNTQIHPDDIGALAREASEHGDYEMAAICERALAGDDTDNPEWDRCREVILASRMEMA